MGSMMGKGAGEGEREERQIGNSSWKEGNGMDGIKNWKGDIEERKEGIKYGKWKERRKRCDEG
jgi:hypothetical protein